MEDLKLEENQASLPSYRMNFPTEQSISIFEVN
jgi:hypothetical protein